MIMRIFVILSFLFLALLAFVLVKYRTSTNNKIMNYAQFIEAISKITTGMNKNQVINILGSPQKKERGIWVYHQTAPTPKPNEGVIEGLEIIFENNKVIKIRPLLVTSMGMISQKHLAGKK